MGFLIGALKVIVLLGTLVLIHEFGHFIVAKAFGMKVLKFSIGFGPKILQKQGKETEYSIRALPLGGFVQLEGEEENSDDPKAFMNQPAWKRILVLLAGVTINILFALLIYIGINMNSNFYITSKITNIPSNSIAEQIGLKEGDEIVRINGEKVYNSYDVSRMIASAERNDFIFEIRNADGRKEMISGEIPKVKMGYIGVSFLGNTVYSVAENSEGERAGLQENDEILSINGESGKTMEEYLSIIKASPEQELQLVVKRNGQEEQIEVVPVGIEKRIFDVDFVCLEDLAFGQNLQYAMKETAYYLRANLIGFSELFTGKTENVEVKGIVGISQQISNTERAVEFFYMMSVISLSLGIMNLLPIPGLDGGKILFTLVEIIRKKPVSREVEGTLTLAGFGILILLMIVVTVSDVVHLF